ncbi:MAG: HNH endonuclease [Gemmataceae bacterium]|nr:HNH endonuclease [Gemmataceae bacterium]
MSVTHIPAELRRLMVARAEGLCEYCLIAVEDTFLGTAADHIISEKHGGPTAEENLAQACAACNNAKGSDVGSIDWATRQFHRFFNPRTDRWADHFRLGDGIIEGVSPIGSVTARLLRFNDAARVLERRALGAAGRYPNAAALRRMA